MKMTTEGKEVARAKKIYIYEDSSWQGGLGGRGKLKVLTDFRTIKTDDDCFQVEIHHEVDQTHR